MDNPLAHSNPVWSSKAQSMEKLLQGGARNYRYRAMQPSPNAEKSLLDFDLSRATAALSVGVAGNLPYNRLPRPPHDSSLTTSCPPNIIYFITAPLHPPPGCLLPTLSSLSTLSFSRLVLQDI